MAPSIEQFLDWFQGVERWQVESVLDTGYRRSRTQ